MLYAGVAWFDISLVGEFQGFETTTPSPCWLQLRLVDLKLIDLKLSIEGRVVCSLEPFLGSFNVTRNLSVRLVG